MPLQNSQKAISTYEKAIFCLSKGMGAFQESDIRIFKGHLRELTHLIVVLRSEQAKQLKNEKLRQELDHIYSDMFTQVTRSIIEENNVNLVKVKLLFERLLGVWKMSAENGASEQELMDALMA